MDTWQDIWKKAEENHNYLFENGVKNAVKLVGLVIRCGICAECVIEYPLFLEGI
jgi:hypothetical protein